MAELVIGGKEREHIVVRVLSRSVPEAEDYWNGNWLRARIELGVSAWRGAYDADLRVDEFIEFRKQLESMHLRLFGKARLKSMEPWLDVTLEMGTLGNVTIEGTACEGIGFTNRLRFTLADIDQSYIPAMLDQLREIERKFPLRGRQDAP